MMLDLNREDGADLVLELDEVEAYSDVENYPTTSFNFRDDEKSITLSRSGNVLKQSYSSRDTFHKMHSLIDYYHFDAFFEAENDANKVFEPHLISANFCGTTLVSNAVKSLNILEELL